MSFFFMFGEDGFKPNNISNLVAWYDANDASTITTATGVSQWNDKSGNNYHLTQGTGSKQPATGSNTLNGKNVLTFTAASVQALSMPQALCSTFTENPGTIFIVARQNSLAQQRLITTATSGNSTRYTVRYSSSTSAIVLQKNSTGSVVSTESEFINVDYNIFCGRHSGSTLAVSINGSNENSNSNGGSVSSVVKGFVGAAGDGVSDPLDGHIAEIIMYNRSLTEAERNQVFRYLYNKWGVLIKGTLDLSSILPTGHTIPFDVTYDGYKFSTDITMSDYKTVPVNTYAVPSVQSTVDAAITAGNAAGENMQVDLASGIYDRNEPWSTRPTVNFNLIGTSTPVLSSRQALTLTQDGTYTNTYTATRSAVGSVTDSTSVDSNGTNRRYTLAASESDCNSTAGSWYLDGSNKLYIHPFDGRDISGGTEGNGIIVLLSVAPPIADEPNTTAYVEDVIVEGFQFSSYLIGDSGVTEQGFKFYLNGGESGYCTNNNNISTNNADEVILYDHTTRDSYLDGFNYKTSNSLTIDCYEINCDAYDCGYSGGSNNCSTMHDGGRVYRFGNFTKGIYSGAEARVIHDIGTNTYSLNVGVTAKDSRGANDNTSINFMIGDGADTGVIGYFLKCKSSGSNKDLRVETGCTAYVDVASGLLFGNNVTNGTGSIKTFIPRIR